MPDWSVWLICAGVLVAFELFIGTFYLLMVALGLSAGAVAAWLGAGWPLQILFAAVVGVAATVMLRRWRYARHPRREAANDATMSLDIGQKLMVQEWHNGRARVMYRGALWDVELGEGEQAMPGEFRIVQVRGNRLVVALS